MRRVQLDTTQINNKRSLKEAIDSLMGFPGWYEDNFLEWLDMITVGQRPEAGLQRFKSAKPELYLIEIMDAGEFFDRKRNLFKLIVERTIEVNERAVEKVGYPVVALTMR